MARTDFENLDDAIAYIKENEKRIDEYDGLETTFNNYKTNTDKSVEDLNKKNSELQKANMQLYLKTIDNVDNKDNNSKNDEDKKESFDDFALEV